jgi:hypothetical protein
MFYHRNSLRAGHHLRAISILAVLAGAGKLTAAAPLPRSDIVLTHNVNACAHCRVLWVLQEERRSDTDDRQFV